MYTGFSITKYKKIMDKLHLNVPTHYCTFYISYTVSSKLYTLTLPSIPCIFDIVNVNTQILKNTSGTIIGTDVTRKYNLFVDKDYFENKTLKASDNTTIPMKIEMLLSAKDNSGYTVKVTLKSSSVIDEEGYVIPQFEINYGDYADGGYRQYLEFVHIKSTTIGA